MFSRPYQRWFWKKKHSWASEYLLLQEDTGSSSSKPGRDVFVPSLPPSTLTHSSSPSQHGIPQQGWCTGAGPGPQMTRTSHWGRCNMDKGILEWMLVWRPIFSITLTASIKFEGNYSLVWSLLLESPTEFLSPFFFYFSISWRWNGLNSMFQICMFAIAPAA